MNRLRIVEGTRGWTELASVNLVLEDKVVAAEVLSLALRIELEVERKYVNQSSQKSGGRTNGVPPTGRRTNGRWSEEGWAV